MYVLYFDDVAYLYCYHYVQVARLEVIQLVLYVGFNGDWGMQALHLYTALNKL